jgi:hypothetical protein
MEADGEVAAFSLSSKVALDTRASVETETLR